MALKLWGHPIALVMEHKVDYLVKKGKLEAECWQQSRQGSDLANKAASSVVAKQE